MREGGSLWEQNLFFFYYTRYGKSCQQFSAGLAANRPPAVSVWRIIGGVIEPDEGIRKVMQTECIGVGFVVFIKCKPKVLSGFSALWVSIDLCSRRTGLERIIRFNQVLPWEAMHYRARAIKEGPFRFATLASHFIRIQIFQIDLPPILSASKYFR